MVAYNKGKFLTTNYVDPIDKYALMDEIRFDYIMPNYVQLFIEQKKLEDASDYI